VGRRTDIRRTCYSFRGRGRHSQDAPTARRTRSLRLRTVEFLDIHRSLESPPINRIKRLGRWPGSCIGRKAGSALAIVARISAGHFARRPIAMAGLLAKRVLKSS
jgi:hypothetical protein